MAEPRPVHECLSDPEATVADGWCNHPGYRHRYGPGPKDSGVRPAAPVTARDEAVKRAARAIQDHTYVRDDAECACGWVPDWTPVDEDGHLDETVQVCEHIARVALEAAS